MTPDDELLGNRSISELEDAERRLREHIEKRRNKPSIERRMVSTAIASILMFGGTVGAISWFSWHPFMPPGLLGLTYLTLMVFGGLMIYSDWVE